MKKYYEVWGDLLANINMLRYILLAAVGCIVLQFFFIFLLAYRPPMIIRIDKLGNVDRVANYQTEALTVTEEDIRDFGRRFLDNYTAVRSDRITYQVKEALNMMTKEYQEQHLKSLKENNIIEEIQVADVKNAITLKEMQIDDAKDTVYVKVDGILATSSLSNVSAEATEKPFVAQMILKKVKKTADTPFGLLLKGYKLDLTSDVPLGKAATTEGASS